jgi:hypothetical protein
MTDPIKIPKPVRPDMSHKTMPITKDAPPPRVKLEAATPPVVKPKAATPPRVKPKAATPPRVKPKAAYQPVAKPEPVAKRHVEAKMATPAAQKKAAGAKSARAFTPRKSAAKTRGRARGKL